MSSIVINNLSTNGASAANDIGAASGADTPAKLVTLVDSTNRKIPTDAGTTQAENIVASGLDAIADGDVYARTTISGAIDANAIAATPGASLAARLQAAANVANGADVTADNAPKAHAASHKHGGSDEIATATPGANVIPKAGADSKLAAGFIPQATNSAVGGALLGASGGATKLTKMPDGATAISGGYEDAWATTAGWSAGAGATIDVSTTPGALRITATATSGFYANKNIAGMSGKIMFVRYRTSANATGVRVFDGINTIATLPVSTNFTVGLVLIPVTSISAMYFGQSTGYVSGSWVEIDGYWIGDYSYLDGSLSEEAARIANELGDTAGVAAAAGGNINFSAANPVQVGDTVTAYGKTYQYVASLSASPGVEGEILWDADVYVNHERLRAAIATGNAGTTSWTTAHPLITMTRPGGNLIGIVSARTPGINGNKIVLSALAAAVSGGRITLSNANGTTGNPINLSGGKDAVGDKIKTQLNATIGAGAAVGAIPTKTATSIIGYFAVADCASGAQVTLPAGGTWAWEVTTYGATYNSVKSGTAAGGAAITGTASANLCMRYERIA